MLTTNAQNGKQVLPGKGSLETGAAVRAPGGIRARLRARPRSYRLLRLGYCVAAAERW